MQSFQPGEQVYVRLVFQNVVPIKNAFVFFVHEEDENEHVALGFQGQDGDHPIAPNQKRVLDFAVTIPRDTKPGVYALDKINFETFGGNSLDYQGNVGPVRFAVIPEHEIAPVGEDVSVFNEAMWRTVKEVERRR